MRRSILTFAWLFLSTGVICTSAAAWQFYRLHPISSSGESTTIVLADNPPLPDQPSGEVKGAAISYGVADGRALIVANFLKRHNSPLKPHDEYGQKLVAIADTYDLDFRLLPAIMMQESNLCKKIPEGSFNCLGFGIHSRGTLAFESYEANFDRAARELKKNYIDKGLTTPEEIMRKYTPSSNGSWANSVNQWMAEMRYDDRQLGRKLGTDTSVLEFAE